MDRGIPTEEVLAEMRASDPPIHYLVGIPQGRLTKLEAELPPLIGRSPMRGVDAKLGPAKQLLRHHVYLHQFKVNFKQAFVGGAWPWHQDFAYWHILDGIPNAALVHRVIRN